MCVLTVFHARWRRGLLLAAVVLLGFGQQGWSRTPRLPEAFVARVTHVHDGDTLWVRPQEGGQPVKLRLEGVDAPEICQPGGEQARDALAAHLGDLPVHVRTRQLDRYGRPLARLTVGDDDVGTWLVLRGYAWSYRYRDSDGPYAMEELLARTLRRGVFASQNPQEPRTFRRQHGPCRQP